MKTPEPGFEVCNFIKKEALVPMKFEKLLRTHFTEHLWTTVSVISKK